MITTSKTAAKTTVRTTARLPGALFLRQCLHHNGYVQVALCHRYLMGS
jgi:hypothetical protein